MEANEIELNELARCWDQLRLEAGKTKKINFELFNDVFSKTHLLLAQQSAETNIDKKYIALIANAFLFANVEIKDLDFKSTAALVLTERMLNQVTSNDISASSNEAVIYILELRKEVHINFTDVSESIEKLTNFFEEDYWKRQSCK